MKIESGGGETYNLLHKIYLYTKSSADLVSNSILFVMSSL
jgi:hypothetical protein